MISSIPVFKPWLEGEPKHLLETLRSSWWGTGKRVEEFEASFAAAVKVNAERCLMLNSCTAALHLACLLYPDAEQFIVPGLTFISTGLAPRYCRKDVIFAEIGDDLCIDPQDALSRVRKATDVVIAVHMGGQVAKLQHMRRQVRVIEDCAHALGAWDEDGYHVGTRSVGCFSFQATKSLPTGDGGMLLLSSPEDRKHAGALSWCGVSSSTWDRVKQESYRWQYEITALGYKYRANDLHAALALDQWPSLCSRQQQKMQIVAAYKSELAGLDWLRLPEPREDTVPSWQEFIVRTTKRNEFADHLASCGISTTVHYTPINHYLPFAWLDEGIVTSYQLPKTDAIAKEILTIPSWAGMSSEEVERVVSAVRTFRP